MIRHPGYGGVLTLWLGYGLAKTSAPSTLLTTLPNLLAYVRRIEAEEAMLADSLGDDYIAYQKSSWRIVPGLY